VAEFSPATLAARLGLSAYAGRELVADALDLSIRVEGSGPLRHAPPGKDPSAA